jgi:DNA-binding XRE family transcriptional regulator
MMNPQEAIAARKTLGLSQDALAASLGLSPDVVAAWEAGSVRVPKRFEEQLRFDAADVERRAALASSGLPECEVDKAWQNEPLPKDLQGQSEYLERGSQHHATCSVCKARDKFVADQFGKMPPMPIPTSARLLGMVADRIENFPRWAQPAAWFALVFGAYSLVRIVFMLPRLARNPQYWAVPLEGLALSISIGGVVGLIYGGYRELRDRIRARRAI